jgi:hypothetical protein
MGKKRDKYCTAKCVLGYNFAAFPSDDRGLHCTKYYFPTVSSSRLQLDSRKCSVLYTSRWELISCRLIRIGCSEIIILYNNLGWSCSTNGGEEERV